MYINHSTPCSDESCFNGCDDLLILVEDGFQLVDVLQHNVLAGVTVRMVLSLRGDIMRKTHTFNTDLLSGFFCLVFFFFFFLNNKRYSLIYGAPSRKRLQRHKHTLISSHTHTHTHTPRASLSGTFLQTLPDLATPLKGYSLSPRSCPPTRSASAEKFGY